MRGTPDRQLALLSSLSTEGLIPADHPIRRIRVVVGTVLSEMDGSFDAMHAKSGRPSAPKGCTAPGPSNATFAYLPDHRPDPHGPQATAVSELISGVDLLIHDAQFLTAESTIARDYGHSTVRQAADLAISAGVGELALFHHAPGRTDDQMDELLADTRRSSDAVSITAARDGEHRDLGHSAGRVRFTRVPDRRRCGRQLRA